MSLSIGIVGLPNVGKSTLFNALIKSKQAEASNYPFCTIEPNVGIVEVPDEKLKQLSEISESAKTVPAVIKFVDIAGLVKGAHKGEGLGNQFLSHIKECEAIAMVVRFFEDSNITHVSSKIDPEEDIKTINLELILHDLSQIEKGLARLEKEKKTGGKETIEKITACQKAKEVLESEKRLEDELSSEEISLLKEIQLITTKPILIIANISENQLNQEIRLADYPIIPICAKTEMDLIELDEKDAFEYLQEIGLQKSGLDRLILAAYQTLGLISYYTSGKQESRAWTIKRGFKAPEAAGVIHTDFQKGFIAAEVIKYNDFIQFKGWQGCREKGLAKTQGKDYTMSPDDVVEFRFKV